MPSRETVESRTSVADAIIQRVFAADRDLNIEAFVRLLSPDVVLRIGSQPPIVGVDAVRRAIGGLFAGMRSGIQHTLQQSWTERSGEEGGSVVYQAEAVFHLRDGRDVSLPYVNVLRIDRSGLVSHYFIYIDLTPLR